MEGINIDVMAYDDCSRNESYMVEVKSRRTDGKKRRTRKGSREIISHPLRDLQSSTTALKKKDFSG